MYRDLLVKDKNLYLFFVPLLFQVVMTCSSFSQGKVNVGFLSLQNVDIFNFLSGIM